MTQHYLIGFLVLVAGSILEVSSRPSSNEFYRWPGWKREYRGWSRHSKRDEYQYDGLNFVKGPSKMDKTSFTLYVNPIAYAMNRKGTALANPISHVIVARNQSATIIHEPLATAVVGPGGVAHAQSDLYIYEYVPL